MKMFCKEFFSINFWYLTSATESTNKIKTFISLVVFLKSGIFLVIFSVGVLAGSAICCLIAEPLACTLRYRCLLLISFFEYLYLFLCLYLLWLPPKHQVIFQQILCSQLTRKNLLPVFQFILQCFHIRTRRNIWFDDRNTSARTKGWGCLFWHMRLPRLACEPKSLQILTCFTFPFLAFSTLEMLSFWGGGKIPTNPHAKMVCPKSNDTQDRRA